MRIEHISAAIDTKLIELDQRLSALREQQLQQPTSSQAESIQSLSALRTKLEKSKAIAWQAHNLQHNTNEAARKRQQNLGLALCGVSLVGGLILIAIIVLQ
jgi:hypothetical protein